MGVQRVNAGIKVLPDLKRALQRQASKEDKTLSKLGEVLLNWAFEQMQIAGDSFVLKTWEARPLKPTSSSIPDFETQAEIARGVHEQHTESSKPREVKRRHAKAKAS